MMGGATDRHRVFFKVFFPQFAQQLEIPPAFVKHLKDKVPATVSLKGPSKNIWNVNVLFNGEERLFFDKGWEEFCSDHALELGDFLVFEYDGGSLFSALVFDKTATEKEAAFSATPRRQRKPRQKHSVKEEVVVVSDDDDVLEEIVKKEEVLYVDDDDTLDESDLMPMKVPVEREITDKEMVKKRKGRHGGMRDLMMKKKKKSEVAGMMFQTIEKRKLQAQRAHFAAHTFESENPFFVAIIKKTNISHSHLRIPNYFCRRYISQLAKKTMVLQRPCGTAWVASMLHSSNGAFLGAGWKKFLDDNGLKEEDVCVFELVQSCNMVVHVYKVVDF